MNHVSQPMAARLQAAGWEGDTHTIFVLCPHETWRPYCKHLITLSWVKWLPAPSIGELLERLKWDDFVAYYRSTMIATHPETEDWFLFACWLYEVTADADALALVWLFTQGKEGK